MNIEGLLPIGSVVRIEKAPQQQLQIVGQGQANPVTKRVTDYSAVLFPQGYFDGDHMVLLDNEVIVQIDAYGYMDDESLEYTQHIENILAMLRDGRMTLDDLGQ